MLTKVAALSKFARSSFFYPAFAFSDFSAQAEKQIYPEDPLKSEPLLPKYLMTKNIDFNSLPKQPKVIYVLNQLTK